MGEIAVDRPSGMHNEPGCSAQNSPPAIESPNTAHQPYLPSSPPKIHSLHFLRSADLPGQTLFALLQAHYFLARDPKFIALLLRVLLSISAFCICVARASLSHQDGAPDVH